MRSFYITLSTLLISTLFLSGCATYPTQTPPAHNKSLSWESRSQTLAKINRWDLKGLVAIRAGNEANSGNLGWQQNKQRYTILLVGPLGTHSYTLYGNPGRVVLEMPNGKKASASSPELLLAKETGWRLPVSSLYYWIRGLPVPNLPAQTRFDTYNHLIELTQQGWRVQYPAYTSVNNTDVPSKIFLSRPRVSVKIVVKQWQF